MRLTTPLAVETPTQIGLDSIRLDVIVPDAAKIDVPVLFGNGERDVSPDPRTEASRFPLCNDFTMFLLPALSPLPDLRQHPAPVLEPDARLVAHHPAKPTPLRQSYQRRRR